MLNGKSIILLVFLIALLTLLPVSADDNVTSETLSVDGANQTVDVQDSLGSVDVVEDNLTAVDSDDSLGDGNVSYHRVATYLSADKFSQNAVDSKVGEKGGYFSVYLTNQYGLQLANKTVTIGWNGVSYNVVTDQMGCARLQINLTKADTYTFALIYLGDDSYDGAFNVATVKITKKATSITANAKTFKSKAKTKKYTVTLKTVKSKNGKTYLSAGKKITLKLKGKTYTAKTNSNGKATFKLKITKKGKFKATIKYAGDGTYKASSKTKYITIK